MSMRISNISKSNIWIPSEPKTTWRGMAELTPTTAAEAEALWRERLQKRMWVAAKYKGAFHPIEISGVAGDEILLCFEQKHEWRKKTDPTIQP
eukprot:1319896-Amorphochlora_amoeboformis.AAC.1